MKHLSLQWRITLMTVLLIGATCVIMNLLLCSSGVYYMDTIADSLQGGSTVILNEGEAASFDPQLIAPDEELTIVIDGAQGRFRTTNWYITAAVTLLSGILTYFVSGRALKPLRSFASQVEQVQLNNLADMRIDEDVIPEFQQLSRSFNQMLERLNNAFAAQRQFTGNAAHELRTPLALMQAQLELFSAEHPDVRPETAEFLTLLREQTERLIQLTRTLLEMSNLRQVARNERIQLAPMIEEIFTDLAPLSDKLGVTLTAEGDGIMTGSDALIYRLIFNLTENAVKYNRPGGSVRVCVTQETEKLLIRVSDTGCGIPEKYQQSIFQPFFRVDKSRSREYGGAGLGSRWYGRSPTSTAAPFGWRKVPRRALPLRWGCQRNNQRSPKTLLFVFRRFARRAAAFLSVWGGQPEREASLFNLKFLAARVRVYVRQLADGVGMNATFLLSISSFIKLPTLEKCEHKNSFIHILLYKFVAQFRVQIIP